MLWHYCFHFVLVRAGVPGAPAVHLGWSAGPLVLLLMYCRDISTSVHRQKVIKRSHKTIEIRIFLIFFLLLMEASGSQYVHILTDPEAMKHPDSEYCSLGSPSCHFSYLPNDRFSCWHYCFHCIGQGWCAWGSRCGPWAECGASRLITYVRTEERFPPVFIDNKSLRRSNKTVEIKVFPIFFFFASDGSIWIPVRTHTYRSGVPETSGSGILLSRVSQLPLPLFTQWSHLLWPYCFHFIGPGLVCLGFPLWTLGGVRGGGGDSLLDLRTPVLFVVGERAAGSNTHDLEDLRQHQNLLV